jgi:DNA-binding transcriptional LysR family regulator
MSFPPEELDVVATPFLDNPLVVVAPAAYPCPPARSAWPTWRPPLPAARNGSGTRKAVDRHLAANGLTLKVKLALGSNEAIRDLVASGMGLAILSATYWVSPEQEGLRILEVAGFPAAAVVSCPFAPENPFPAGACLHE